MTKRKRWIGVGSTTLGDREKYYINKVLRSSRLSYGPLTRSFEEEFAHLHERKYAVLCNSGTSALQVSLHALKEQYRWQDGDEVIVPALTFVATVNVVLQNNLTPVFVDVDPYCYEMDPQKLADVQAGKARALLPVHLCGQPCDMDPIMEFARERGLKVLEDSCETVFATYKGQPTGSWGDVACFSTYVAHLVVTGVGGLALTNDAGLALLIRSLVNHGRDGIYFSVDDSDAEGEMLRQVVTRRFSFERIGYSYRATEMEAALGLAQLERRHTMLETRRRNAERLTQGLRPYEEYLQLPTIRDETEHAFMFFPIVIRSDAIDREDLTFFLESHNVETRYLLPLLSQPIYKRLFGDIARNFPVAARIDKQGFYIGCHQDLSDEDIDYVIEIFEKYFKSKGLRKKR